jgi:hypothetical protein
MLWFFGSVIIFLGIAIIMTLTGFLMVNLFQKNQANHVLRLEEIAISALIGTAFWVLFSGTLSYLGLTFNQIRWGIVPAGILILLFLMMKYRNDPPRILNTRKVSLVLALAFLAGTVSMLPLLLQNTFYLASDSLSYVTIGDFLQTHSFITPATSNLSFPSLFQVVSYQSNGLRMGANFLLALITSWTFNLRSVDVYPAVLAWGIVLNAFSLFLWMRWGLRASHRVIVLALFFLTVTPNAIQISAVHGFFPQTFGTAAFFLAITILVRIVRASNFSVKMASLLGIAWAFQISVYSELFPVLVIVSAVPCLFALVRSIQKKRLKPFLKTWSFSLALAAVLSHYELFRFMQSIPAQLSANVGWRIPPDLFQFWEQAISVKPFETQQNWGFLLAAGIMSLLFFVGLWQIIKTKQLVPLSMLVTCLLMVGYFWFSKDANMYKAMWSIYKIAQWSSLLLISFAFLGLAFLPFPKIFNTVAIIFCTAGIIPLVWFFNDLGGSMQGYAASNAPIQEYYQLANMIKAYHKPVAYQLSPETIWPASLPIYFLMNTPLQGNWGPYISNDFIADKLPKISDTLFYCLACPFPNPRNPLLPANATVIQEPVIYDIYDKKHKLLDYHLSGSQLNFPVSKDKGACIFIFSPKAGHAIMTLTIQSIRKIDRSSGVLLYDQTGWQYPLSISPTQVDVPLELEIGNNQICLESKDHTNTVSIFDLRLLP